MLFVYFAQHKFIKNIQLKYNQQKLGNYSTSLCIFIKKNCVYWDAAKKSPVAWVLVKLKHIVFHILVLITNKLFDL